MFEDLRSAARSVVRARGLTAVLLVSLALGTGANAAVCGIVYKLLLAPPDGVRRAGELVSVYTSEFSGAPFGRTSYPDFLSLSERVQAESIAAFDDNLFANVRIAPEPDGADTKSGNERRARIAAVTPTFFSTLRLPAHEGRLLESADSATEPPGAVISFALASALDTPATIVGRTLQAGRERFTVIGVGPEMFRGLQSSRPTDLWVPLQGLDSGERGDRRLSVIARIHDDADAVNERLLALGDTLARQYPESNRGTVVDPDAPRKLTALPYTAFDPESRSEAKVIATVVATAVALLLAGACVNAGTLLLSRAMARRREVAVKMALGAGRFALARQLLLESLLISCAGGALGLVFATWIVRAVPAMFSPDHAALLDTDIDALLVALTIGIATLAGVVFGVAPAIHGTGAPAALALRADSGGISEQHGGLRMRAILITAQLSVSTLLLITTSVLAAGLSESLQGDFGVRSANVVMLAMQNPGGNCTIYDPIRGVRFHHALAQALPKVSGISSVGWSSIPPLGRASVRQYAIQSGAKTLDRVDLNVNVVTPGYFRTLGIELIEGRPFDAGDGARSDAVAIVDELLARRHFGATAVGQHLLDADGEPVKIVGVVKSGRYRTLQDSPQPTVYLPYSQEHLACGFLFVRTASEPTGMFALIGGKLTALDGGVTITRTTTLEQHLSEALAIDRLTTTLVGLCGIIALLMAMAGVYGVMSDAVVRRTREIGLRVALGAGRPQVVKLVFMEATYLTVTGIVLGLAAALGLEQVAASFVYGLPQLNVATLTTAPAILAAVVAVAAIPPLRRALAVSPTIALRAE
jgi:predicted permease